MNILGLVLTFVVVGLAFFIVPGIIAFVREKIAKTKLPVKFFEPEGEQTVGPFSWKELHAIFYGIISVAGLFNYYNLKPEEQAALVEKTHYFKTTQTVVIFVLSVIVGYLAFTGSLTELSWIGQFTPGWGGGIVVFLGTFGGLRSWVSRFDWKVVQKLRG